MATETHRLLTTFLLLYLCFFTSCSSSSTSGGMVLEGSKKGIMMNPNPRVFEKVGRKILMTDLADYDETGANPRHDPRRGRSGRNP